MWTPDLDTPSGDPDYPSGRWTGFYLERGARRGQDLDLSFVSGRMHGDGWDRIGRFVITGRYDGDTGAVRWTKSYLGAHDVHYTGFRDGKGIWGTWTIGALTGGFHIWPRGSGSGPAVHEEVAEPVPVVVGPLSPFGPLP